MARLETHLSLSPKYSPFHPPQMEVDTTHCYIARMNRLKERSVETYTAVAFTTVTWTESSSTAQLK